jgi:hypothetical protein
VKTRTTEEGAYSIGEGMVMPGMKVERVHPHIESETVIRVGEDGVDLGESKQWELLLLSRDAREVQERRRRSFKNGVDKSAGCHSKKEDDLRKKIVEVRGNERNCIQSLFNHICKVFEIEHVHVIVHWSETVDSGDEEEERLAELLFDLWSQVWLPTEEGLGDREYTETRSTVYVIVGRGGVQMAMVDPLLFSVLSVCLRIDKE